MSIGWHEYYFSFARADGEDGEIHYPDTKKTTDLQQNSSQFCQVLIQHFKQNLSLPWKILGVDE